ncbi:protein phosphatase inhibitor 2-like isoform X1 [Apodemus sylvaticus]|uniref:protein phosphatase inhibitor 2-like isoform X1 n=1 Tax=Apodemus sylvaticus TaxID=10129 RepID=UPI002243DA2F|nr:protein phosphatase inhibitor 2-like isoform X1 [Apodemus sylvaticus]
MAASMASQGPIKGILKNKTSPSSPVVASAEQPRLTFKKKLNKKSQKWDEVNILATYHPADKDYGLMKIGEPNTLYRNPITCDDDANSDSECNEMMSPDFLAKKLAVDDVSEPKDMEQESSEEEDNCLSPQDLEKKRQFEMKRKLHYNEGLNIKLARLLISNDDDEDEGMSETAD